MADKSSAPLLAKLEKEPNNAVLLAQIARNYSAAEQLPEAISYYRRAVQADPKHVGNRADLASQLFYAGKVDEAIAALEEAGRYEPNNPQVLFNLGMMRWKGKGDAESAVAVWTKLLKSNPDLPADRKKQVEMAIAKLRGSAK